MKNKTQRERHISSLCKWWGVRGFAGAKSERAASLVELCVVLPILGFLLLGVIDFGRAYYLGVEVQNAAEAGALYGTQNLTDITGMQNAATGDMSDVTSSVASGAKDVSATPTATATNGCECSNGTSVTPSTEPTVSACPTATQPTCTAPATVVSYVKVTTSATYNLWFRSWILKGLPMSIKLTGSAKLRQ